MNNKLNIVLTVIIVLLIGYIVYDKYIDNREVASVNGIIIDNKINEDVKYFTYSKNVSLESDDMVYKSIYLFDDNTYYYSYSDEGSNCNNWSKGSYVFDSNSLVLNEKVYGGCDLCYYTDKTKTYNFKFINDSLISDKNEMLVLSKVNILPVIEVEKLDGVKKCSI